MKIYTDTTELFISITKFFTLITLLFTAISILGLIIPSICGSGDCRTSLSFYLIFVLPVSFFSLLTIIFFRVDEINRTKYANYTTDLKEKKLWEKVIVLKFCLDYVPC